MWKIINLLEFYLLSAFFLFCSSHQYRINNTGKKNKFLIYLALLILFFGLRDIGLDLEPYKIIFNEFQGYQYETLIELFSSKLEPLHGILISLVKSFGLGFEVYLFIAAIIPIGVVGYVLWRVDTNPILSLFFLMLTIAFPAMDAVRHFVAAGFYFGSLYLMSKGRNLNAFIFVMLSIISHYSNALVIFTNKILLIRFTLKGYFLTLVLALIAAVVLSEFIGKILLDLAGASDAALVFKLSYYINNVDEYEYEGLLHYWLLQVRSLYYIALIILLNFYVLNVGIKKIFPDKFSELTFASQLIGSIIAVFLVFLGARDFAARVNFLMSIGSFLVIKNIVTFGVGSGVVKFSILTSILFLYNFIIVLYLAGVHQAASPFYLG